MRLHAIDEDDAVRPLRLDAAKDVHAVRAGADPLDLHRRANRHAHALFSDAVTFEHAELAFGRRSTMTAHRGEDERLGAGGFEDVQHLPDNTFDVRDASTADGHGDLRAGLNS